jgi:hypothetical protein
VASWPSGVATRAARRRIRRMVQWDSAPDGLGGEKGHHCALAAGICVVAAFCVHPAGACVAIQRAVVRVAACSEPEHLTAQQLFRIPKGEDMPVRCRGCAAAPLRAVAEGGGDVERGVALELPDGMWRADAVDVGDVAVIEPSVPSLGLGCGGGGAVAFVAKADGVGGCGGTAEHGVDGLQAGIVAVGAVGAVDGGVSEAIVLGDVDAATAALIEDVSQARHIEAEAALHNGAR